MSHLFWLIQSQLNQAIWITFAGTLNQVAVAKISTESLADTETSHEEVGSTAVLSETRYVYVYVFVFV